MQEIYRIVEKLSRFITFGFLIHLNSPFRTGPLHKMEYLHPHTGMYLSILGDRTNTFDF
jgi:hypothetical protein